MIRVFIGLGSNLNNPVLQIQTAIKKLQCLVNTKWITVSSFYQTKPVGLQNQPDFVNAVAEIQTRLSALSLLNHLQIIENNQGRIRTIHGGPRTLDLDILLYGDENIHKENLKIPHPELKKRSFVLAPLFEIAPDLTFPDGGCIRQLISDFAVDEIRKVDF